MTDLSVVIEKLQSFEIADDLADYFRGYGIKATPRNPFACPIAQYVEKETGLSGVVTGACSVRIENEYGEQLEVFTHSDAMIDFVERYDKGSYLDLVEEGYDFNDYICCPNCG